MIRYLLCISFLSYISVDSARILGVFPVPSISHQVVFRALTMELARRGHELVIITTDPALPKDRPPDNVTEIDVSFGYQKLREMMVHAMKYNILKRGVILTSEVNLLVDNRNITMVPIIVDMIEHPEVKKYTTDKNQKFDLVIAENILNYHLILGEIFKAPVIWFSSFHGFHESYETIGAPTRHPLMYPSMLSELFDSVGVIGKMKQIKFEYDYYRAVKTIESYENDALRENYGPDAPTVEELRSNVEMLFLNSHPVFCGNRPMPPNAVYVGPLHLQPLKELPQELRTYLDNSKTGVIYVSLGSNVRPSMMDADLLAAFLDAFRELPYDILWKFDGDNLKNVSINVKIQKWFPQRDLLVHPNIKLFVTQGGLQSTDEAIDAGVPLVGLPVMGDQYYNTHKYTQLGIGVKLDAMTLNKEALLEGIRKVLNDDSYKKNIIKLKHVMNDQPQTPLERAVWWTEYVIRHGGAKHMRFSAATISWTEFFIIDVVIPVITVVIGAIILVYIAVKCVVANAFKSRKVKQS